MPPTSEPNKIYGRIDIIERQLRRQRLMLGTQSIIVAVLAIIVVQMRFARPPGGAAIQAPLLVHGTDGRVILSVDELSAEHPVPTTSRWLQLARPATGVCLTLNNRSSRPALQLICGEKKTGESVSGVRFYAASGNPGLAMETVDTESRLQMTNMRGEQSQIDLRSAGNSAEFILQSDRGTGLSAVAGGDASTLTLSDRLGDRRVQALGTGAGGWIGAFQGTQRSSDPWSNLAPSGLYVHPNGGERVTASMYSDRRSGGIAISSTAGKSLYRAP